MSKLKGKNEMAKYKVTIIRTSWSSCEFEVEAENEHDAQELAYDKAVNTVFDEYDAEYTVDNIEEQK